MSCNMPGCDNDAVIQQGLLQWCEEHAEPKVKFTPLDDGPIDRERFQSSQFDPNIDRGGRTIPIFDEDGDEIGKYKRLGEDTGKGNRW